MRPVIFILFLILAQHKVLAHEGQGCGPGGRLADTLELDEAQSGAFQKIMEDQKSRRMEIMQKHREQMKEKMQSLHAETRTQLSSILTEDQLAKFDAMRAKRMERFRKTRDSDHAASGITEL